jgi:hypothetical protein
MTLDERLAQLRQAIDAEASRARHDLLEALSRHNKALRSASNEIHWDAALADAEREFQRDPQALEFLKATTPKPSASKHSEEFPRAQRFARVKVAEIQLYHASGVKSGRASRNIYGVLKPQIDAAREAYREKFHGPDFLHFQIVRLLANDDASLLGADYPGPMGNL